MMDTCVCCGAVILEGRMVCWACENRQGVSPERTNDMKETMNPLYAVVAAALGVLSSYLVQLVIPLAVLVVAMLVDYGTGMARRGAVLPDRYPGHPEEAGVPGDRAGRHGRGLPAAVRHGTGRHPH